MSSPDRTISPDRIADRPQDGAPNASPDALGKAYRPSETEPAITALWDRSGAFGADPAAVLGGSRRPYCILIPPPNVTAALHLGHALNNTLQDVLIRAHRMMGYETLWLPGTDHASIATQAVVEKRILKEEGKRRRDFKGESGRAEFVARIQAFKDEYEATIISQLKAMGCSCDWSRQRFTMDAMCTRAVREAFFQLFKHGLIYRGKRLVNWDPALQTAVADDECYDDEVDANFWYLNYPLEAPTMLPDGTTCDSVTVATTRPETYLADTAVALNPRDPRAASLVGKHIILPFVGRRIPIIADSYVVLPESLATTDDERNDPKARFTTGFLKVTPAHDANDYELGRRHSLPLINMMSPDGLVSGEHGWTDHGEAAKFIGLSMGEARKRIVSEFKSNGLLAEVRPYRHSIKFSERSKAVIEPYLSDQWYVRVTDDAFAPSANAALVPDQRTSGAPRSESPDDGGLRFFPSRYSKTFEAWHDNIRDWCISRQLWWGHRISVWTRDVAGPSLGARLESWVNDERIAIQSSSDGPDRICVRDPEGADRNIAEALVQAGYTQDPDVLDTWFSSALWPLGTLGWPDKTPDLSAFNPSTVLCTAREIITLWVSRMVMFNRYFMGIGRGRGPLPFKDVFIHAMIMDGEGHKMSKSLGNGVDPRDIIASHGSDAMRFTMVHMTTQTQDVRMPVIRDAATGANTSPKFDAGRNFCNKLWNAARLVQSKLDVVSPHQGVVEPESLSLVDRWILSRLANSISTVDRCLAEYEFSEYAQSLYDILWRDFCDWYLEGVKPTIDQSAPQRAVLRAVLDAILRLLHPIAPFITEAIHQSLRHAPAPTIRGLLLPHSAMLCNAAWPRADAALLSPDVETRFERLRTLLTAVREVRASHQVPPKRRIVLHAPAHLRAACAEADPLVHSLAMLELIATDAPNGPAVAFSFEGAECHLSRLTDAASSVDSGAERERLEKLIADKSRLIATIDARLGNPGYVQKAPAKLVEESKAQREQAIRDRDAAASALRAFP